MTNTDAISKIAPQVEDPFRLAQFLKDTSNLDWSAQSKIDSLSKVFVALDDIAQTEVKYYYTARRRAMRWSQVLRGAAWGFGSLGALIPLLAATAHPRFINWAPWGYVNLALAACFFAANSLFDGTAGHIRFVTTQLMLEKHITQTRLKWFKYRADQADASPADIAQGFTILVEYAEGLYLAIINETGEWSRLVQEELSKYQRQLDHNLTPRSGRTPISP